MRKPNDSGIAFGETMIGYMESLIDKRDYAGAVEYFEANRQHLDSVDATTEASILRHLARALAWDTDLWMDFRSNATWMARCKTAALGRLGSHVGACNRSSVLLAG